MCGEFSWKGGNGRIIKKDETKRFLVQTGLMFSNDWIDQCAIQHNYLLHANRVSPVFFLLTHIYI